MNFKMTKLEKQWVMYDVGNSAFTLLIATILPIYFNYLTSSAGISESNYTAYWGYAASITTLLVALSGPIFGTMADYKGFKKPIFTIALAIGAVGCLALGFATEWFGFLVIFVIAKFGYSISLVFYDSMLGDVTDEERMDMVSSQGYAWGYIGSCVPFIVCLLVVLNYSKLGLTMKTAMMISFVIVAVWWVCCTLPLLKNYRQRYFIERQPHAVRSSFARLGESLMHLRQDRLVFLFLLAFFFYIDGVYTIIDMATTYGTALGLNTTGLLLALLVTQIVAFPCSIIFGRLAQKFAGSTLISVSIVAYTLIVIYAVFMREQWQFWVLAVCVGMFQGGIQALSRSYFARIVPKEKSGEYFGLMDICGKGAAFMGTMMVSVVTQLTDNSSMGVGSIVILFVIGFILFRKTVAAEKSC